MSAVEETVEREKHTTAAVRAMCCACTNALPSGDARSLTQQQPKAVRKEYEEDDDADAFMMSRATKQKETLQRYERAVRSAVLLSRAVAGDG